MKSSLQEIYKIQTKQYKKQIQLKKSLGIFLQKLENKFGSETKEDVPTPAKKQNEDVTLSIFCK